MNSTSPGYTEGDRAEAQRQVRVLVTKHPDVMNTRDLGQFPNDSLYHAEATVMLRAARNNRGTLAGQRFEVHVDRELCLRCERVLPLLSRELGNPTVTFVDHRGTRRTISNGKWTE